MLNSARWRLHVRRRRTPSEIWDELAATRGGEHFRLHLARMALRVFWRQFVARVESVEASGPHELLAASFVGGPKHLPVRIRVRPARLG